jgi:hypothetical protein
MTVKELLNRLNSIKDKNLPILIPSEDMIKEWDILNEFLVEKDIQAIFFSTDEENINAIKTNELIEKLNIFVKNNYGNYTVYAPNGLYDMESDEEDSDVEEITEIRYLKENKIVLI